MAVVQSPCRFKKHVSLRKNSQRINNLARFVGGVFLSRCQRLAALFITKKILLVTHRDTRRCIGGSGAMYRL